MAQKGPTHAMIVYALPRRKGVYRFKRKVVPIDKVNEEIKNIQQQIQEKVKTLQQAH